jgi:hypothetical protein
MSMPLLSRRTFLTLPLSALLTNATRAHAAPQTHAAPQIVTGRYAADVGILYDLLSLRLEGSIEERLDWVRGEYRVRANGSGQGIANRLESMGILIRGRWAPVQTESWFDVRGRESVTRVGYDWANSQVIYHARAETFFLRRVRTVDDILPMPRGVHIDDVMTATLNFADGRWLPQPDGSHRTLVVRRRRADDEGPDDVATSYRAEIVPFELIVDVDASGKRTARFDLSRFSSWAKPSEPARIIFDSSGRPEVIRTSMILGSSVKITFTRA